MGNVLGRPPKNGQFKKGQSGNPKGLAAHPGKVKQREILRDLKDYCKAYSKDAIDVLVEVMKNKGAPPSSRIAAANAVLDRGFGKPQITVETTVSAYDKMSDAELISHITGNVIEGEVLEILGEAQNDLEEDEEY